MTQEERYIAANIHIMNDKVHGRLFMTHEEFADKIRGYQVEVFKVLVPLISMHRKVEGKNYYNDWLKIAYSL